MTRSPHYKWFVVAMLWFVCLFNYADRQAIFSLFPLLKTQFSLSDVQLGYIASSFMWVYALAGPLAGLAGDRFSRKAMILGGLIFWSLITVATALATSYSQFVCFRALEGLGEAFYFPASMSMLSAYHGPDTRSRAMSWHQSSVYAGTVLGGTAAGWLADHYGWRAGFLLFGSAGVLLALFLWRMLDEPRQPYVRGPRKLNGGIAQAARIIFGTPMIIILICVFIGANFVAMIFLTWLPSYLNQVFHMSLTLAGWSATAYLQIASVLGVLTGGWIADRWRRTYQGGRMMTQAAGLLLGVPFLFASGFVTVVPGFVAAIIGFGFFKGIYDANIWASLHDVTPVEWRATAVGVMNSLGWLGGGIAPVAVAAASTSYGMSKCLSATSGIYAAIGVTLICGTWLAMRNKPVTIETPPPSEPFLVE